MSTPGTVKRSELQPWRMVAGNEDRYPIVIDEGVKKEWAAIGWISTGPASDEDKATYPTVVED
jgi:hypothetical protein